MEALRVLPGLFFGFWRVVMNRRADVTYCAKLRLFNLLHCLLATSCSVFLCPIPPARTSSPPSSSISAHQSFWSGVFNAWQRAHCLRLALSPIWAFHACYIPVWKSAVAVTSCVLLRIPCTNREPLTSRPRSATIYRIKASCSGERVL
jgi:hypothetical protein